MKKHSKVQTAWSRVDIQVLLFTACMVVVSSACVFMIAYHYTHADMLYSLTERVESIYAFLEQELDEQTFAEINTKQDMEKALYREKKELFYTIKQATGVQYLYTAKRAENGQLVYVIDGLDQDASDFRYPGDPIEAEIVATLERALSNEKMMPDDIKQTDWGDIFIAYLPIHGSEGEVVGALGIEFAAEHQYMIYLRLRQLIPIVILLVCLISGVTALFLFRRLSNPMYQDLASTDLLTGLKNRNAYELDTRNRMAKGNANGVGLLLADLNGLKQTNDTLGHEAGDQYIRAMAQAMRAAHSGKEVLYRIGGDEFAVLVPRATMQTMQHLAQQLEKCFAQDKAQLQPQASFALGFAICEGNGPNVFDVAYRAADTAMYERKKQYYESVRSGAHALQE